MYKGISQELGIVLKDQSVPTLDSSLFIVNLRIQLKLIY